MEVLTESLTQPLTSAVLKRSTDILLHSFCCDASEVIILKQSTVNFLTLSTGLIVNMGGRCGLGPSRWGDCCP